jgi:calcineurin-like phosphoesterase
MIKLELTVDECNTILRVLGKHPFEEVVTIINKIKQQGEPQVVAMEAEATKNASSEAPAEKA